MQGQLCKPGVNLHRPTLDALGSVAAVSEDPLAALGDDPSDLCDVVEIS